MVNPSLHPRRALVFSAGGAFGAYQAGVWQALEEARWQPDLLAGASIGAVNAAAVARGASARRLQQWWRDPASNIFHGNWTRSLRHRLQELLQEFPPTSAAARLLVTATRLPSTRIEVFQDDQVTASVLQASCAVPVFFSPVRLAGRLYIDGGIFRRLPAIPTAGAIAVDLLHAPPSRLLRFLLNFAISLRSLFLHDPAGVTPSLLIHPRRRLGSPRDLLRWDLSLIDRWIDQGYRDARRALADSGRLTS